MGYPAASVQLFSSKETELPMFLHEPSLLRASHDVALRFPQYICGPTEGIRRVHAMVVAILSLVVGQYYNEK